MERKIRDNYFIGLTLPENVSSLIEREREWMQKRWGNRSGMATAPHITLIPPFQSTLSINDLKEVLSRVKSNSLSVVIQGHGSFGNRTIYARVEENGEMNELLKKLKNLLKANNIPFKDEKHFTPHVTIANRNIKPESFIPSMEYLESLKLYEKFTLSSFALFEFYNYRWHVVDTFNFSS